MKNYEKLRRKINEILPERVGGIFIGTEVLMRGDSLWRVLDCSDYGGCSEYCCECKNCRNPDPIYLMTSFGKKCNCPKSKIAEILGKPLTILDVMAAYCNNSSRGRLELDDFGTLTHLDEHYITIANWATNLQSPLSSQEELCGEFLNLFF